MSSLGDLINEGLGKTKSASAAGKDTCPTCGQAVDKSDQDLYNQLKDKADKQVNGG